MKKIPIYSSYVPKFPNNIILITIINKMTNPNIPRVEMDKAIVFNRPFTLNIAVMNEPSNSPNNNNRSKDSGKRSNT